MGGTSLQSIWKLVRNQHGVVTRRQLLARNYTRKAIEHRLHRGRLHKLYRGVYAVGRREVTRYGLWMAAVLACGEGAALCHGSAGALWGFAEETEAIEVSVPAHRSVERPGIKPHRRTALKITRRFNIPVTSPADTLIDLATRLSGTQLERAINDADKLDLIDPERLRYEVEQTTPRPGTARLTKALDRHTVTDSDLEILFLPISDAAGLARPLTQHRVNGFRVDFYYPDLGLIVETDGLRYHRTPAQQARDRLRDQTHTANGLTCLRFTRAQVKFDPGHVQHVLAAVCDNSAAVAISDALGERKTVDVAAGTIEYRERGDGPPMVFVHGAAVNADLWRKVVPDLSATHKTIALDVPLGGHSIPLEPDADLSLYGVAKIVADVMEELDLGDVTVVGNDTGGAVSQALVASRPERIGRLVLTSCDAFENFPPTAVAYLKPTAKVPPAMWLLSQATRIKPFRRLPITYGWATHTPIPGPITDSFLHGIQTDKQVRRDFSRMLKAAEKRDTVRAAEELRTFDKPAIVIWAADDKFFPIEDGEQLAERLPQGQFELIPDSRTFIPEDQPGPLTELIREFVS